MSAGRTTLWLVAFAASLAALRVPATAHSAGSASNAYVDVSVATLWSSPEAPRSGDRPALGNPVDMREWSGSLDTPARRQLVGRIETQALYGERLLVLERRGRWARVVVPDQPTPRDRRGYPGWLPTVQLAPAPMFGRLLQGGVAVVSQPTAELQVAPSAIELSYGTRLPVVGVSGSDVVVATPEGKTGRVFRSAVTLYRSAAAVPHPTGREIVAAARRFVGVRYLWGGTSAFGFDCSGLIQLVYRAHGIVIPRDADAQAAAGTPVTPSRLRLGDLLFYGQKHVHHAALYIGDGRMIEAPNSAGSVRLRPVRTAAYAGARRFLGEVSMR